MKAELLCTALWCVVDQGLAVGGEISVEQLEKLHLAMPYLVDAPSLAGQQEDWDAWLSPSPQPQPRARVRGHISSHRHHTHSTVSSHMNESGASSSASSTLSAGPININNNNNNNNENNKEAIADPPHKRRSLSPACSSMSVDGDEH